MKSYIVDSFTKEPFKGNPAAVCFPEKEITEEKMLQIAREFGLSETAFVFSTNKKGIYTIRYFSPKKEIPLCGHATLAAATILFREIEATEFHFITINKADLIIKKQDEGIIMQFPVYQTIPAEAPSAMLKAVGIEKINNAVYSEKNKIIMLEITDAALLAALKPDFQALIQSYDGINGVLVTASSNDQEYDYHYRYFWPWAGTNEDPVTGGVQTFLAKYWSQKLGKTKMKAYQSSARTGYMTVEMHGDAVWVYGHAVVILEGNLLSY